MMTSENNDSTLIPPKAKWLRRLWGALPALFLIFLVLIIIILFGRIKNGKELLEAQKKGVHILEGLHTGVTNIETVVEILQSAQSTKEAKETLQKRLTLSPKQAKAVSEMRLINLTQLERRKLEKHIATLRREMSAGQRGLKDQPVANVVALKIVPRPIRDRIDLPGTLKPWADLNVVAEVRGKVIEKTVTEGTRVKKGEIIVKLDQRESRNDFDSAKASYDMALAQLNRLKELYKEQLATREQLDNVTAQMKRLKAAMDNAALNLERCDIRAPIDGVVNQIYIEKGQYLSTSDKVAEILQMDRVKVEVGIPESDVDAVRRVDDYQVRIDALDGKIYSAKKHFLSNTADAMARLYNLDLMIENTTGEILPDMFARIEIVKQEVSEGISIPLYAVISRGETNIVYVVNSEKAHRREVELGLQEGWMVQITKGLKSGDKVIVVGHRDVNDEQPVNVVRTVQDPQDVIK